MVPSAPVKATLKTTAALAITAVLSLASPDARADDKADARAAYERGRTAFDHGEFAKATLELARADELAPNAVALEAALRAALKAGDAALGMELSDRATLRPTGTAIPELGRKAREAFAPRAARLTARCGNKPCSATLDNRSLPIGAPRWVEAGDHVMAFTRDGKASLQAVHIEAGKDQELAPAEDAPRAGVPAAAPTAAPTLPPTTTATTAPTTAPTTPAAPAPPADDAGISPLWFAVGASATVGLGAVAVIEGLQTKTLHDTFAQHPNSSGAEDGKASELRTNVFFAATGIAAAATVALGIFAVRWSPKAGPGTARSIGVAPGPGPGLTLDARY